MIYTSVTSIRVDSRRDLLNPRIDNSVILRVSPLDNFSVCEVSLRRVEAKGVSTTGLRGLGPHGLNGLPDELDLRNVLGRDLGLELREMREKG